MAHVFHADTRCGVAVNGYKKGTSGSRHWTLARKRRLYPWPLQYPLWPVTTSRVRVANQHYWLVAAAALETHGYGIDTADGDTTHPLSAG